MIDSSYINCIKVKVPVDQLDAMIADLQSIMSRFDLSSFVKFQRMFITDQEALDIFHSIDKYEPSNDLAYYQSLVTDRFAMYAHDLANEESLAKLLQEQQIRVAQAEQELKADIATNTLIAQAETLIVETPKVKREIKIVVIESEAWAMAVLTNFIKNWQYVNKYVKVKSWAKLSIGQMAEALAKHISETGETFTNLQTEEVCK
jgi:predicted metal-dependent hydrolase